MKSYQAQKNLNNSNFEEVCREIGSSVFKIDPEEMKDVETSISKDFIETFLRFYFKTTDQLKNCFIEYDAETKSTSENCSPSFPCMILCNKVETYDYTFYLILMVILLVFLNVLAIGISIWYLGKRPGGNYFERQPLLNNNN